MWMSVHKNNSNKYIDRLLEDRCLSSELHHMIVPCSLLTSNLAEAENLLLHMILTQ